MSATFAERNPPMWPKRQQDDLYIAFCGKIDIYWSSDLGVFGILKGEVIKPHPPMSMQPEHWYLFALEEARLSGLI